MAPNRLSLSPLAAVRHTAASYITVYQLPLIRLIYSQPQTIILNSGDLLVQVVGRSLPPAATVFSLGKSGPLQISLPYCYLIE
jgi:hypothetical protein